MSFSPCKGNDGVVGGATGNQHAQEQVGTENKTEIRMKTNIQVPKASNSSDVTFRLWNVNPKNIHLCK